MQKELIDSISFVKSSKYRFKVLNALNKRELLTPKEISNFVTIRQNHVSMTLTELSNNNLVQCVNAESKRGRLYQITKLGKITLNWIEDNV